MFRFRPLQHVATADRVVSRTPEQLQQFRAYYQVFLDLSGLYEERRLPPRVRRPPGRSRHSRAGGGKEAMEMTQMELVGSVPASWPEMPARPAEEDA